jgi:hypothetical protein
MSQMPWKCYTIGFVQDFEGKYIVIDLITKLYILLHEGHFNELSKCTVTQSHIARTKTRSPQ